MKRYSYRIAVEVEHFSRDECIRKLEELVFKYKLGGWPEEKEASSGGYPMPKTVVEVGPIKPTMLDRLERIEREIETRLGGLSEDAA